MRSADPPKGVAAQRLPQTTIPEASRDGAEFGVAARRNGQQGGVEFGSIHWIGWTHEKYLDELVAVEVVERAGYCRYGFP